MNIDLVLIGLQVIFISLYGVTEVVESKLTGKSRWLSVLSSYLAVCLLGFFFPEQMKENIQLVLFVLLLLVVALEVLAVPLSTGRLFLASILTILSYGLIYLQVENMGLWLVTPLLFGATFLLVEKWRNRFSEALPFLLRAPMLLTVLLMLEPMFLGIQQNLKPVPTIPINSIINQQNFLLLGALVLLVVSGFFWKEKLRP